MNNAMKLLKENSVFWSKLGFCYDPPRLDSNGKPIVFFENYDRFAGFHKDFAAAGVKVHTSILFSGWVGVDRYDYELTDRVLDAILKDNPDIYYIPRIKLNVPLDWGKEKAEDVFVYFDGTRDVEEIRRLVGTDKHDSLGYESKTGYYTVGNWKLSELKVAWVVFASVDKIYQLDADAGMIETPEHGGINGSSFGVPHACVIVLKK